MLFRNGSTPLYLQLKEAIRQKIESGAWAVGERIPSERELCELYQVSRITVRQAIAAAINEGLLFRQQGKGTYVAKPKINQTLASVTSFCDTMLSMGLAPSTRILGWKAVPVDMQLAQILDLPVYAQVINLKLLGLGSGQPMVVYDSAFPYDLGMKLVEKAEELQERGEPFSTLDLYSATGSKMPHTARQTFEANVADEVWSRLMQIKKGFPLFIITSLFLDNEGRPLEFRKAVYRGDKYKFSITRAMNPF